MRLKINTRAAFLSGILVLLALSVPGTAFAENVRWKLATLAPKHVGWAQQVQGLVFPWIEESTDGNLKVKVYWGGVMGNDEEYIKKIHIGQLQGAGISGAGANQACPEFTVLGLPFMFNGYPEVDYVRGIMYDTFDYYFQENGFKLFIWLDADFDQCYSTKWPMDKLDDFKRSRFQNWYGPLEAAVLESLGTSPLKMTVIEGHSGFKTGMIDASFGPAIYMVGSQLYTLFKYVNPMNIRYAPGVVVIDKKSWDALPLEWKEKFREKRNEITQEFVEGSRAENARCLEGMIQYGVKLVTLSDQEKEILKQKTRPVWDELAGEVYPKSLLMELTQHLDDYRSGRKRSPGMVAVRPAIVETPIVEEPQETPPEPMTPAMEKVAPQKAEAEAMLAEYGEAYKDSMEAQKQAEERIKAAPAEEIVKPAPKEKRLSAWEKRRILIRNVQEKLKPLGFYPGKIDGIFGPITYRGILDYQRTRGLVPTGAIDNTLLESMGIEVE